MRRLAIVFSVGALACGAVALGPAATPASASIPSAVCGVAGFFSGLAGKACDAVTAPGSLLSTGKKLLGGLLGHGGSAAAKVAGFAALAVWVIGGAKFAVDSVMKVLGETTEPDLTTTWFSGAYWRIVGIAAVLTLPFLFAAAIQALLHSDLAMLLRAAFGYLPLAMLAIGIAGPLTMLLLSASDEMSSLVTAAAGGGGGAPASISKLALVGVGGFGSAFFGFLVAALTAAGALVLWLELVVREAAVYVIVLMLPLAFAAMVWPARRVWAIRAVELLVALILSKFAITAVLVLGGDAVGPTGGVTAAVAGIAMLLMAAFAPWAMLRLLPFSEVASAAGGALGQHGRAGARSLGSGDSPTRQLAHALQDAVDSVPARLRGDAEQVERPGPEDLVTRAEAAADGGGRGGMEQGGEAGADGIPDGTAAGDGSGVEVAAGVPINGAGGEVAAGVPINGAGGELAASVPVNTANGGAAAAADDPPPPTERMPGFDSIWQMGNGEWRPLFDDQGRLQSPQPPADAGPPSGSPPAPAPDPQPEPAPDPRPDPQPREETS
jgi:type IV secretion system protein TrbL